MLQMFVLALSLYNTWNRGVFLLCKITNLLIYSIIKREEDLSKIELDYADEITYNAQITVNKYAWFNRALCVDIGSMCCILILIIIA